MDGFTLRNTLGHASSATTGHDLPSAQASQRRHKQRRQDWRVYGAGSQTWAASYVWALWRVEDNDASYDTHLILRCLKGRFCEINTAWNLDGCKEDFSHRVVSVVNPSDLLPLKAISVKEQALALIVGSGRQWTIKDISQAIGCNQEHARRTLQSLMTENQIARHKLRSTGGRPLYAYTELDFPYTPQYPLHCLLDK